MKDTHKWTTGKILLVVINCILCLTIVLSSMIIVIDKSRISNGSVDSGILAADSDGTDTNTNNDTSSGTATARMMCAGDNLIHGSIYKQANNRANGNGYDFSYAYDQIRDIISLADIAFLNQETIMDSENEPSNYPLFNSPTELLDEMISVGFDVFNQSTNHTLDKGVDGAKNNINLYKNKSDVLLTGLYETREEMFKPQVKTVNGIRFSFVGFTEWMNGIPIPEDSDIGLVCLEDGRYTEAEIYETMKQMISNAKAVSDVVCVSMHWHDEDITTPDSSQKKVVEKLLEYGADVIIGTGPHVLQPIEYKQNCDGEEALVIWSLGNFISCQDKRNNMLGGIADITFEKDLKTGKTSVSSVYLIPTITHYNDSFTNVRIIPLANYNEELASQHGVNSSSFTYSYINEFYAEMFDEKLKVNYKN